MPSTDQSQQIPVAAVTFMLVSILLYSLFLLIGIFATVQIPGFTFAGLGRQPIQPKSACQGVAIRIFRWATGTFAESGRKTIAVKPNRPRLHCLPQHTGHQSYRHMT